MTREEANLTIDYLKEMQESYIEGEGYERHPLPEWHALDKAIKALEQEPKSEWQKDHEILKAYSDGANGVLDEIRAEIDCQEKWLMSAGCNAYNVDIAFNSIKSVLSESEE